MSHYRLYGLYYGYPLCCIEEFIATFCNHGPLRAEAGQGTGFLPCQKHAEMIAAGEINLIDLISNRACDTPFPIDDMDVEAGPDRVRFRIDRYSHIMFPDKRMKPEIIINSK